MNANTSSTKKEHWFTTQQRELIENIKIEKKAEKTARKQERRALRILNKLPEDIVKLCLEFVDEKQKKQNHITKITNLFKKYVGNLDNLNSAKYEDFPIYKLLESIPKKILIKFIKCGTPSRYYQKIFNNTLFNNYKVKNSLYKTLVDRYEGPNNLHSHTCAWEITKLVRFAFNEIMVEGENLYNTDFKKYKEYDLHFKKYEKYTTRLINSIIYLHNKYTNKQ
jgi:hypothetical protein